MNWNFGLREEDRDAMIMWVNGAAGTGKSAIAQTIAERCHNLGLLLSSFFFLLGPTLRQTMRNY